MPTPSRTAGYITVILDPADKEQVRQEADRDRRTLSNWIQVLVKDELHRRRSERSAKGEVT